MEHYDVVVIGSGPAGEGAAMMLSKNHRRVAVVERYEDVGGGCTHWGTIPSKALRHSVKTIATPQIPAVPARRRAPAGDDPAAAVDRRQGHRGQVQLRQRFYDRNRVPVLHGEASFIDPHTLRDPAAGPRRTASRGPFRDRHGLTPVPSAGRGLLAPARARQRHHPAYPDSPFAVTIYGAGVIGCEYASIFLNMGTKVTLVNTQDRLLSFMDEEIAEALSYHLRDQGCVIRHNEQFESLETRERDVLLKLKSGRRIKSDLLLWANGRTGNTDGMNLEGIGLAPNQRGQIPVNERYQTAVPHIYAAGDVIGPPALASAAYQQGSFVGQAILDPATAPAPLELVPSGIYTIPEISSVGQSERELQAAGVPYEIGHTHFKSLARAQMTGNRVGMLKILFHTQTLKVLGVHCFGDNASEIVHIGQAVMSCADNDVRHFIRTTFNYPTMAEAYRIAAYNGLNRLA
jgi:NAD(P) transhydrogenase